MAGNKSRNRAGHSEGQHSREQGSYAYVEGNAVRMAEPVNQAEGSRGTSRATKKNRERALQMNLGYVLFLTGAAVVTVFMCVNYLKLQSESTKLRKEVTALEVQLDEAKLENDSDYNRIMANVDMEYVKEVAMDKLGMNYAKKGQIVTYSRNDSDYVRQYTDVPKE